jgi:hypothetical protein
LLHPAYAKQSVAIAQAISDFEHTKKLRLLKIGTGPGTPLQLLLEMIPALEVVAVEPSTVAFTHLSNLFKDDKPGLLEAAASRCRRLLHDLKALVFPEKVSHPRLGFYRFHYLELEALVAGLDYEVEQKTYPSRFLDLALHARFELIKHSRLYATHGDSEWDAGTHLFVLKRLP